MKKKEKFAVIADDITGASDTGVQFEKQGLDTILVMAAENVKEFLGKTCVIIVNTDSRSDPPKKAYEKVRAVVKALKEAGIESLYKKIDSTLRGNIGPELDATISELNTISIVAPAFPANGRITIGGYQLVNHVPVSETEFANDPITPVKESHVPTLLKSQTRRKVGHINLSKVIKGTRPLVREIDKQQKKGKEIIVIDATTQEYLRRIAEATIISSTRKVLCGSAGFAEELPRAFKLTISHPVVVIAGSVSYVTRQQIWKTEHILNAHIIDVDPCEVLARATNNEAKEKEVKKVAEEAISAINNWKDVVIASARQENSLIRAKRRGKELKLNDVEISERISRALGEIAFEILENKRIAGLVLTGGSTAMGVCITLGAKGASIEDEIMPGIPCMSLIGGKYAGLRVITKAGGFGDENALLHAIKYLKRKKP